MWLLQIATDRGPRDLRMRCAGGAASVQAIITDLAMTVQVRRMHGVVTLIDS